MSATGVGVAVEGGEACLTATHFSFFSLPSSSAALSDSSSEVTLSSVSASTPVLVSSSELEDEALLSEVAASSVGVAAGADSVVVVEGVVDESLFEASLSFFAFARSFLSSFSLASFSSFYVK